MAAGFSGDGGAAVLTLPKLPSLPPLPPLPIVAMNAKDAVPDAAKARKEEASPQAAPSAKKGKALRAAFLSLLDKHGPALQRYAVRLASDPERGREAVRLAFVSLASQGPAGGFAQLPEEKRIEKLYRAVREAALGQLKGEARRAREPKTDAPTDPVRLGLNQVQEEMLRLKFECGLGYPAIAAILDVAPAHVSRLVHAALSQARQGLEAKGATP